MFYIYNLLKIAVLSVEKREAKMSQELNFDAKLCFALLAAPRPTIFSEIHVDNLLLSSPAGVNL
jgi:hypothetical protein